MSERQFVKLSHDGAISTILIDRQDRLNALDGTVVSELGSAIDEIGARRATRCVIITGAGKAFVAGADIAAMKEMSLEQSTAFSQLGHDTFAKIEALPMPVIAVVNGFALGGGCELALSCDFIYASEKAKMGQPEVKLGVIPGFGGTQRLARRVGLAMARELCFTGDMINADEALRIGLVNKVFAPDALMAEAQKTAATIASMGPKAVAACKQVLFDGEGIPLPKANPLEVQAFAGLFGNGEQQEGMGAFLEKRAPSFDDR